MILLAKAQIIGGIVPNLIAFGYFLEQLDILLQIKKWPKRSAGKQELTAIEVTAGVEKRLPDFMD